jgi:uncharacterized protein YbjT (DUF2867 family)
MVIFEHILLTMSRLAIIAGSSGLVGTELLHQLCASKEFSAVKLLVRRPSGFIHAKVQEFIVDFDHVETFAEHITGDVFFSCLGSTKAKTPDKRRYYQIDHDFPVRMAEAAKANGMKQFHLISAVGANPSSSNFYLKMKGETERDIAAVSFPSTHIYRPAFLDGNREERRMLEKIGLAIFRAINPLMIGGLKKYRSIKARDVAKAMIQQSLKDKTGVHYYESNQVQEIANENM